MELSKRAEGSTSSRCRPEYCLHWPPSFVTFPRPSKNAKTLSRIIIIMTIPIKTQFIISAFFRDFTQRRTVITYRRFWITYQSQFHSLNFEDGTDRLPRNVGMELPYTLRKIPEECRFHLHQSGSLKSHNNS
jgi:hypothetical protein